MTRTPGQQFRKLLLYPLSYEGGGRIILVEGNGAGESVAGPFVAEERLLVAAPGEPARRCPYCLFTSLCEVVHMNGRSPRAADASNEYFVALDEE